MSNSIQTTNNLGGRTPSFETPTALKVVAVASVIGMIIAGVAAARFPVGSPSFYSMIGTGAVALVVFTTAIVVAVRQYRDYEARKSTHPEESGAIEELAQREQMSEAAGLANAEEQGAVEELAEREQMSEAAGLANAEEQGAAEGPTDLEEGSEAGGLADLGEEGDLEGPTHPKEGSEAEGPTDLEEGSEAGGLADLGEEGDLEGPTHPKEGLDVGGAADSRQMEDVRGSTHLEEEQTLEQIIPKWNQRILNKVGYESNWENFSLDNSFDFSGKQFLKDVKRQTILINGKPIPQECSPDEVVKALDEAIDPPNLTAEEKARADERNAKIVRDWQNSAKEGEILSLSHIYHILMNQALSADCYRALQKEYAVQSPSSGITLRVSGLIFDVDPSTDRLEMTMLGDFTPYDLDFKPPLASFEAKVVVNLQTVQVQTKWEIKPPHKKRMFENGGIPYTILVNGRRETRYYNPPPLS